MLNKSLFPSEKVFTEKKYLSIKKKIYFKEWWKFVAIEGCSQ